MAKPVKDYKILTCKLEQRVNDRLESFAAKTGLTKTAAVEHALDYYLDYYEKTGKIKPE